MKKYIFGALALLTLAACSSDDLVNNEDAKSPIEDQDVSVMESSVMGSYDMLKDEDMDGKHTAITRAGIDNGLNATWSVGDELSVSDGTLMYNYDVTKTINGGIGAVFEVAGNHKAHISDGTQSFYAMYPRRSITEAYGAGGWNGSVVKGQVFAQQSYKENMGKADAGKNFGGYYVTTDKATVSIEEGVTRLTFAFSPLASVIDVDLTNTELETGDALAGVYVRDLSGKTIAAHFSYDCSSKTLTTTDNGTCNYNYSSHSDVAGVSFYESEDANGNITYTALGEDKVVRIYLLPVKLSAGVEITLCTAKGKYYTKKSSASVGNEYAAEENGINSADTKLSAIVKPFYKKYSFGGISTARKGAWMACVPQNLYPHMLTMPGAHDASTSSCTSASKTQNVTIEEQLKLGVRAFDLRPSVKSSTLELKHGSVSTGVTLADAVNTMKTYLKSNPSECVFAFIHQEMPTVGSVSDSEKATWSNNVYALVKATVDEGMAMEALTSSAGFSSGRGKIVFIYRDDLTGDTKVYNSAKVAWNDNIARTVYLRGTNGAEMTDFKVSYQDIYSNSSIETSDAGLSGYFQQKGGVINDNEKITMVKKYIDFAENNTERMFVINFASYAGGSLTSISTHVNNIMPSINQYLATRNGRLGIIFADFVDGVYGNLNFTALTTAANFKYMFDKRSRMQVIKSYDTSSPGIGVAGDDSADGSTVYAKEHKLLY